MTFLTEDDKILLGTGKDVIIRFIFREIKYPIMLFLQLLEEVLPATWKSDLSGEEWHVLAAPSDDIFSANKDGTKGNFNHVAKRLFDSQ